jgi:hypothetical protein
MFMLALILVSMLLLAFVLSLSLAAAVVVVRLVTVFSARNYFAGEPNDGALILLTRGEDGCLRAKAKRLLHREDGV